MPLKIIQGDITRVKADAIVNAANSSLLGGGGVDGAIHRAAGPQLLEACLRIGGCPTGEARITPGFLLPADYVIHTVGPVWAGGRAGELELLASCYRASLAIALEKNLSSIAFPLISAGAYGFPADTAASIAIREIRAFLQTHEMLVWLVVYDRGTFRMSDDRFSSILDFIGQNMEISEDDDGDGGRPDPELRTVILSAPRLDEPQPERRFSLNSPRDFSPERLELELDETFSQRLLRWIDARGMTDAQCYRKANIDRKLFSKIRSNIYYQPSKPTVLAFAAALELNLDQTKDLLLSAGFALSRSLHSDLIFRYYIESGIWDIFEINEALFAFGEKPLP